MLWLWRFLCALRHTPCGERFTQDLTNLSVSSKITSVTKMIVLLMRKDSAKSMARKESITIQNILDTAFLMTRQEGYQSATARKVAAKAGCSTQPIFRVYKNMEELSEAVYGKAVDFFRDYYELYPGISVIPFVNLGMAYISFAREEKNLFELLFLSNVPYKRSLYEILNGNQGSVVAEICAAKEAGCQDAGGMFRKMWIFIHGIACMSLSGDYDLSDMETKGMLEQSFHSFAS